MIHAIRQSTGSPCKEKLKKKCIAFGPYCQLSKVKRRVAVITGGGKNNLTDLLPFAESSAVCISEMLLHVSKAEFIDGICLTERFLVHVEALFTALDQLDTLYHETNLGTFKYIPYAKSLCKKIINFFSLLARSQDKVNDNQELLALVTSLAHRLKILIRSGLTAALVLVKQLDI